MSLEYDIVICCGPKDISGLDTMISYTKQNVKHYRKIFIISSVPLLDTFDCIIINEDMFPFSYTIINETLNSKERTGWYLQQLLKLYAWKVIPDIHDNYLVIDADTFIMKPTSFMIEDVDTKQIYPLIDYRKTYRHLPYVNHIQNLHPLLVYDIDYSGICHHMLFQKHILSHLFSLVESHHCIEFWKAFIQQIDAKETMKSAASEYELYFVFLHVFYQEQFMYRQLISRDHNELIHDDPNLDILSIHWYWR